MRGGTLPGLYMSSGRWDGTWSGLRVSPDSTWSGLRVSHERWDRSSTVSPGQLARRSEGSGDNRGLLDSLDKEYGLKGQFN